MKQTVTRSNKHLQEIFYRHNLPETAETSVTNETDLKKLDIFHMPQMSGKAWPFI